MTATCAKLGERYNFNYWNNCSNDRTQILRNILQIYVSIWTRIFISEISKLEPKPTYISYVPDLYYLNKRKFARQISSCSRLWSLPASTYGDKYTTIICCCLNTQMGLCLQEIKLEVNSIYNQIWILVIVYKETWWDCLHLTIIDTLF